MHQDRILRISAEKSEAKGIKSEFHGKLEQASSKGHILFFHNAGTMSHLNVLKALAQGLLESGHKVTTAFYAKTKIVHENYSEILIKDRYIVWFIIWLDTLVYFYAN